MADDQKKYYKSLAKQKMDDEAIDRHQKFLEDRQELRKSPVKKGSFMESRDKPWGEALKEKLGRDPFEGKKKPVDFDNPGKMKSPKNFAEKINKKLGRSALKTGLKQLPIIGGIIGAMSAASPAEAAVQLGAEVLPPGVEEAATPSMIGADEPSKVLQDPNSTPEEREAAMRILEKLSNEGRFR